MQTLTESRRWDQLCGLDGPSRLRKSHNVFVFFLLLMSFGLPWTNEKISFPLGNTAKKAEPQCSFSQMPINIIWSLTSNYIGNVMTDGHVSSKKTYSVRDVCAFPERGSRDAQTTPLCPITAGLRPDWNEVVPVCSAYLCFPATCDVTAIYKKKSSLYAHVGCEQHVCKHARSGFGTFPCGGAHTLVR